MSESIDPQCPDTPEGYTRSFNILIQTLLQKYGDSVKVKVSQEGE